MQLRLKVILCVSERARCVHSSVWFQARWDWVCGVPFCNLDCVTLSCVEIGFALIAEPVCFAVCSTAPFVTVTICADLVSESA